MNIIKDKLSKEDKHLIDFVTHMHPVWKKHYKKVHWLVNRNNYTSSACGKGIVNFSVKISEITCKTCKKSPEYKEAYIEHCVKRMTK